MEYTDVVLQDFRVRTPGTNDAEWSTQEGWWRASREKIRETAGGAAVFVRGFRRGDRVQHGDAAVGANFGGGPGRLLRRCPESLRYGDASEAADRSRPRRV